MRNLLLISAVVFVILATTTLCLGQGARDKNDPFGQFAKTVNSPPIPPPAVESEGVSSSIPEPDDPIATEVFRLNFANAKDTKDTVGTLLSPDGKVGIDDRLNSIIVTDVKSNLARIRQTLAKLDIKAPQVMIEVMIVNVKLTKELKMGVDWTRLGRPNLFFSQGLSALGSVNPLGKITFAATSGNWSFEGLIDFIESNSNVRILANPKVLVLNNHTALIDSVEEIPYRELTETSAGGSIGTVSFKEAGIKLEVTPQITADGYIIMHIKPEQSAQTGTFTIENSETPVIETRKAETTLRVRDGQTIIIGGLRRREPSVVKSKVPILGDIPLIGHLFTKSDTDGLESELGIFITPYIYTDGKLSDEELELLEEAGAAIELEPAASAVKRKPAVGDSLASDPRWSTSGQWAFGVPAGLGDSKHGYPDPSGGHTGSNVYGVNLKGNYSTAAGGPYYLTGGPFDLTGYYETELTFSSWLNSDSADYVVHSLQISLDGRRWTTLWQQAGNKGITSAQWYDKVHDISHIADDAGTVYVRWGYEILLDRVKPHSGWNIDDVRLNGRLKSLARHRRKSLSDSQSRKAGER